MVAPGRSAKSAAGSACATVFHAPNGSLALTEWILAPRSISSCLPPCDMHAIANWCASAFTARATMNSKGKGAEVVCDGVDGAGVAT